MIKSNEIKNFFAYEKGQEVAHCFCGWWGTTNKHNGNKKLKNKAYKQLKQGVVCNSCDRQIEEWKKEDK